jgi:26S proteasome regulatory subunit N1
MGAVDALSRLSHDQDSDVAAAALLGLGLVGAGEDLGRCAYTMGGERVAAVVCSRQLAMLRMLVVTTAVAAHPVCLHVHICRQPSRCLPATLHPGSSYLLHTCHAGTNNARLAGMLRSLAAYYAKEPGQLFLVRLAQGLVHAGKGLLTLCPYHTDRQLLSGESCMGAWW